MIKKVLQLLAIIPGVFFYLVHPVIKCLQLLNMYTYSVYKSILIKGASWSVIFRPRVRVFGVNNIFIESGVVIDKYTTLYSVGNDKYNTSELRILSNTNIGESAHITAVNKIVIGRNVLIGKNVTITDNYHGEIIKSCLDIPPIDREMYSPGPVIIGENVWIGDKVVVLPNVIIGRNAIVGAGTIVTKDIPENAVVVGNPGRIVKIL